MFIHDTRGENPSKGEYGARREIRNMSLFSDRFVTRTPARGRAGMARPGAAGYF